MNPIVQQIRKDLLSCVDTAYKKNTTTFFKEPIQSLGVRKPIASRIGRAYYKQIKQLPKNDFFSVCESLLQRGTMEEIAIAFDWSYKKIDTYTISDFDLFERWLVRYVSNWAHCDDLCTHTLGYLVWTYPELVSKTVSWRTNANRWLRRASAVVFIHPMWNGNKPVSKAQYLHDVFSTADTLLLDTDDLVQKGYGWMLKATADRFPKEVFSYVLEHKHHMPRTALRYAIEKFPLDMKKQAMNIS